MTKREQERRENISKTMKGVPKSEEHRKNISKATKGVPKSEEHKKNISKALKGVPMAEEHKKNLREVLTKVNGKKVINLDTGEVFDSATLAAESVNRSKGAITHAVKGRSKSCGGYRWEYLTD